MQIVRQQPSTAAMDSTPNQPERKPVQRALCTVVVGKSQNSFAWLEKSLDKFAIRKSENSGKSIIIVDNKSMAMLQRYASGNSTLYHRLLDRNVTFITSKSVMKFIRTKYGNNPLPQLLRDLRQLPFTDQGKADLKDHLRTTILKLLCPDYAFSRYQQLQRVGVVDVDSLIPIQPRATALTGKSQVPISLRVDLSIETLDGCTFRTPDSVFADSEFILRLLKQPAMTPKWPSTIHKISYGSRIHDSFREFGSAQRAKELSEGVSQMADHLQQYVWFAMPAESKEKFLARRYLAEGDQLIGAGYGVKNLVRDLNYPAALICFQHCIDLRRKDVDTCPATMLCAKSRYELQGIVTSFLFNPLLLVSLQSLVRDIATLSPTTDVHLCCGNGARQNTPDFCHNALDRTQCLQTVNETGDYHLVHLVGIVRDQDFNYDVLFHKDAIDKLLSSFSSPLMDWNFQSSDPYLMVLVDQQPRSIMALGREHADILLGNASAFFQLDASWTLACPQKTASAQSAPESTLLDQPIAGFKYGAVTGLADELFSFTPLPTRYSWLYNSARGLLFGGQVGLALGLGEHVYLQYIEPMLPDGLLKACIRPVASNTFLAAALMQGQALGVLGSVAGYTAVRTAGKMVRYLWPRSQQNTAEQARNK